MQEHIPTYEEALSLLKEFSKSDSLMKHAYSVEGMMRYVARQLAWEVSTLPLNYTRLC